MLAKLKQIKRFLETMNCQLMLVQEATRQTCESVSEAAVPNEVLTSAVGQWVHALGGTC